MCPVHALVKGNASAGIAQGIDQPFFHLLIFPICFCLLVEPADIWPHGEDAERKSPQKGNGKFQDLQNHPALSIIQSLVQITARRIPAIPGQRMRRLGDNIIRIKTAKAGDFQHSSGQKARIAHAGNRAGHFLAVLVAQFRLCHALGLGRIFNALVDVQRLAGFIIILYI